MTTNNEAIAALAIIEEALHEASDMSACLIEYELGEGLSPDVTEKRQKLVKAYVNGLDKIKTIRTALQQSANVGVLVEALDETTELVRLLHSNLSKITGGQTIYTPMLERAEKALTKFHNTEKKS